MPFQFRSLEIPEVTLVEAQHFEDDRGFFMETYKMSAFTQAGIPHPFVQENHSYSVRGVLRGLHYQKHPRAQGKLVRVVKGEVLDVAVDLRKHAPTYGRWVSVSLSDKCFQMLYIPAGFAHGFCVLSEAAEVVYKVTAEYAPDLARGVLWNDPTLGIPWPISDPILSSADTRLPVLEQADNNFEAR
jgi:dTDP-4-dehydrorhamnose 3,5-epimerase